MGVATGTTSCSSSLSCLSFKVRSITPTIDVPLVSSVGAIYKERSCRNMRSCLGISTKQQLSQTFFISPCLQNDQFNGAECFDNKVKIYSIHCLQLEVKYSNQYTRETKKGLQRTEPSQETLYCFKLDFFYAWNDESIMISDSI